MLFHRDHLSGDEYSWNSHNGRQEFAGEPSRRLFDRFNGDQLLFIINFYGSLAVGFSVEEGRRIERMINDRMPFDIKSEISVFNWIKKEMLSSPASI